MMKGKLKQAANKKTWLLVREDGKEMQVPPRGVSRDLYPLDLNRHNGLEVEYDLEGGQPAKVRGVGAEWQPPQPTEPVQGRGRPQDGGRGRPREQKRGRESSSVVRVSLPGNFHNPYNFIPAPPRNLADPELGDHKPTGHDRYRPDRWSGRISVKLTTHSPLLIFDAGQMEFFKNDRKLDHKIFPVRLDADGEPYLAPTSIKGMLRSAFEAVTNSRFAIFEKHQQRLAYRMEAKGGPVPARVEKNRNGQEVLRIMKAAVMGFAAKLPRYEENGQPRDKGENNQNVSKRYSDGKLPRHGDAVWVQLDRGRVTKIERRENKTSPPGNWKEGWACVTGPNINKKRYERVFLERNDDYPITVEEKHRSLWRELIQNYRDAHERDLKQRDHKGDRPQDYLGKEPGKTGWSRHIWETTKPELLEGTLCYVEFVGESTTDIAALIPVTISRRLYSVSPDCLLPDSLKPARILKELSPADRVFGWVRQSGSNYDQGMNHSPAAYRGNLRIGPVRCISSDPVETFKYPGLPLAILGQPKPQQARFYVAASNKADAQRDGISKQEAGYAPGKGLRGRKVYPHHAGLPETYWLHPTEDRTQRSVNGFFQEYRRPHEPIKQNGEARLDGESLGFELNLNDDAEQRDDQNRSIKSWVRPGVAFELEIDVTNLSSVELGALLWLMSDDHFHRLGGGKPLGFGSVRLEVEWDKTELHKGDWWRVSYYTLDGNHEPDKTDDQDADPRACINNFTNAVSTSYDNVDFDHVSFIAAFRRSVQGMGDGKPLHYPRALQRAQHRNGTIPPSPDGKAFEWFVANERTGRDGGPKLSLPDLENDDGLPILEAR